MNIEKVKIETLVPDPSNFRIHTTKNLDAIKASLRMFGQQSPLVVGKNNVVLKGNGGLKCMIELGWKEVEIVRSDLEGTQAKFYTIADNRSAELAEWDLEQLSLGIQADEGEGKSGDFGRKLMILGWTDAEIEPLRLAEWNPDAPLEVMPGTVSEAPPPSLFLDFSPRQLEALASPMKLWRDWHPSGASKDDSEVLVEIAEQWEKWHKRGADKI